MTTVAEQNIFQRRTPDSVRSRVMGGLEGIVHGTLALSYVVAAFALSAVGPRGMYALLGVAAALSALVLLPLVRLGRTDARPAANRPDR